MCTVLRNQNSEIINPFRSWAVFLSSAHFPQCAPGLFPSLLPVPLTNGAHPSVVFLHVAGSSPDTVASSSTASLTPSLLAAALFKPRCTAPSLPLPSSSPRAETLNSRGYIFVSGELLPSATPASTPRRRSSLFFPRVRPELLAISPNLIWCIVQRVAGAPVVFPSSGGTPPSFGPPPFLTHCLGRAPLELSRSTPRRPKLRPSPSTTEAPPRRVPEPSAAGRRRQRRPQLPPAFRTRQPTRGEPLSLFPFLFWLMHLGSAFPVERRRALPPPASSGLLCARPGRARCLPAARATTGLAERRSPAALRRCMGSLQQGGPPPSVGRRSLCIWAQPKNRSSIEPERNSKIFSNFPISNNQQRIKFITNPILIQKLQILYLQKP